MRCDEVRQVLEERGNELPLTVREHLAACPECRAYAEGWKTMRAGFRVLAEEPVQEASFGFALRVTRRLEDLVNAGRSGKDYVENAGRRFVYAALLLTAMYVMAMLLPSTGPLRGPATADLYLAKTEALQTYRDPLFSADTADVLEAAPENTEPGAARPEIVPPRRNVPDESTGRKSAPRAR